MAKENVRPREDLDEAAAAAAEKRPRIDEAAAFVLTVACRPIGRCVDSFPNVTVSLKEGPGVIKTLVKYLFDSKLTKCIGETEDSHIWYVRKGENRRTLICSYPYAESDDSHEEDEAERMDPDKLVEGNEMYFSYDEHSGRPVEYKFVVLKRAPLVNPDEELPRATTTAPRSDFTQAEKTESEAYRRRREELSRGGRLVFFSRSRAYRERGNGISELPAEDWSDYELNSMMFLIKAGVGFKAAWKDLLQYALLSRSEAATSNKFYSVKKNLTPVAVATDAQKERLRQSAFNNLLALREDSLTRTSVAVLEGMFAKAWASFHSWDEFRQLSQMRNDELTEDQRQRRSALFEKYT